MAIFYTDSGSIDILAVIQLSASAGITGSLFGTASFATTAQTISGTVTSASYADTASYVQLAQTASYVTTAQTASYVNGANVVGNIAGNAANITAYTINQNLSTTSQVTFGGVTSSLLGTSSWASNSVTASYVTTAQTASYVLQAISASYAGTASMIEITDTTTGVGPYYVVFVSQSSGIRTPRVDSTGLTYNATTDTLSTTASWASNAVTASYSTQTISKGGTVYNSNGITENASYIVWRAAFPCTVNKIYAYREGGTATQINALKNTSLLTGSNYSIASTATWLDIGTLQNTSVATGDALYIVVSGSGASPTEISVQIDLTRA